MTNSVPQPLRVLLVGLSQDSSASALASLASIELRTHSQRADSRHELLAALERKWDLILTDTMPALDGMEALTLIRQLDAAVHVIVMCGRIGEEAAAERMRAGASDIVLRDQPTHLGPALVRALADVDTRPEHAPSGTSADASRESATSASDRRAADSRGRRFPDREREQLFQAVVENTPDLIARFGRDLRRHYVNPAIERLTGLPASELTGKTMAELNFDQRFTGPIERGLIEVFTTGAETTLEVFLPSPDGERVFQARIVPERGNGSEVEFALVISRDITSIRRDEERLRALTREVEFLLASTYEGICAVDLSGRCTLVNAPAATMLGYSAGEMMGHAFHELVHLRRDGTPACTAADCALMKVADGKTPASSTQETLRRKDGRSLPVEVFISPILGDDQAVRGTAFSFVDVTERQHLQGELERATRMAGLGRVASAMSHEFNNVLMGIQPFAEILLRSSQEPRVVDAATRILQTVKRGRGITEDLRAFTNPVAPLRTSFDVRSWLSSYSEELRQLLPPSIKFELEVEDTPMSIEADGNQLLRVLRNLILNARDAIAPAAGSVRLTVSRTTNRGLSRTDGPFVHFSVFDDGPGIAPANLGRVFEPFYTTKANAKGLGLAIAQQIATLHGGSLSVESEPGRGTSVLFSLPESGGAEARPVETPEAASQSRWPAEILLVEDDEAVATGVMMLLEDEGVTVHLGRDGKEALTILESARPQALVIDINLPDCNGFDLYERIAATFGPLPVVFASGHAQADRMKGLPAPARAHLITKPYEISALLSLLQSLRPTGPEL